MADPNVAFLDGSRVDGTGETGATTANLDSGQLTANGQADARLRSTADRVLDIIRGKVQVARDFVDGLAELLEDEQTAVRRAAGVLACEAEQYVDDDELKSVLRGLRAGFPSLVPGQVAAQLEGALEKSGDPSRRDLLLRFLAAFRQFTHLAECPQNGQGTEAVIRGVQELDSTALAAADLAATQGSPALAERLLYDSSGMCRPAWKVARVQSSFAHETLARLQARAPKPKYRYLVAGLAIAGACVVTLCVILLIWSLVGSSSAASLDDQASEKPIADAESEPPGVWPDSMAGLIPLWI